MSIFLDSFFIIKTFSGDHSSHGTSLYMGIEDINHLEDGKYTHIQNKYLNEFLWGHNRETRIRQYLFFLLYCQQNNILGHSSDYPIVDKKKSKVFRRTL